MVLIFAPRCLKNDVKKETGWFLITYATMVIWQIKRIVAATRYEIPISPVERPSPPTIGRMNENYNQYKKYSISYFSYGVFDSYSKKLLQQLWIHVVY